MPGVKETVGPYQHGLSKEVRLRIRYGWKQYKETKEWRQAVSNFDAVLEAVIDQRVTLAARKGTEINRQKVIDELKEDELFRLLDRL